MKKRKRYFVTEKKLRGRTPLIQLKGTEILITNGAEATMIAVFIKGEGVRDLRSLQP